MKAQEFLFNSHGDSRGKLVALEEGKEFPFTVRRFYYIYDTLGDVRRGFHAHKQLKQLLFCPNGSCKLHLDDGREQREVLLDSPDKGLLLTGVIWREMYDFAPGTVLAVLASAVYDESDYMREYSDFAKYVKEHEEVYE